MKLVVLSGKGGVGKSSITASLAIMLARDKRVVCADCDVDASNLPLVLNATPHETHEIRSAQKAVINENCQRCGLCVDACYFNAIKWVDQKPRISGCEGCGTCTIVCPHEAITLEPIANATLSIAKGSGMDIVSAQLKIGESGSGKIVNTVKETAEKLEHDIMLIDAAAGVGCPVIASVNGAEKALLVVEPTPTSLADMKRANKLLDHFRIPRAIIINKKDIGDTKPIEEFAEENSVPICASLPYDRRFVQALVDLKPIITTAPDLESAFAPIVSYIGL
ncbi:MAG: P-loop NTPase [Nanobdellota archaeon]